MITPQPPKNSNYREAAITKAIGIIMERGIQPDARFDAVQYWNDWIIKVGLHTDSDSIYCFWRDVIYGLILHGVENGTNTLFVEKYIKNNIITKEPLQMGKQFDLHPVRLLNAFFSKKELKKATYMLGTILASAAIRANIAKLEFPAWYPYLWYAWMWLDSATTRGEKVLANSIEKTSTDSIYKNGDKYIVNGVQYNNLEAMALVSQLTMLLKGDETPDQ